MSDSVRVVAPRGARSISVDGATYPVKDGAARVEGYRATDLRGVADTLPGISVSFNLPSVAEVRCTGCRRGKLALFGPTCPHCGGSCV